MTRYIQFCGDVTLMNRNNTLRIYNYDRREVYILRSEDPNHSGMIVDWESPEKMEEDAIGFLDSIDEWWLEDGKLEFHAECIVCEKKFALTELYADGHGAPGIVTTVYYCPEDLHYMDQ